MIDAKLLAGKSSKPAKKSKREPLREIFSNNIIANCQTLVPRSFDSNSNLSKLIVSKTHTSDENNCKEVVFPPGSMGLELEPVIVSSERQIGCRIKSYFIGIGHDGLPLHKLRELVSLTDCISHIDGDSVISLPFLDILDILRNKKMQSRIIRFKDIRASCKIQQSG